MATPMSNLVKRFGRNHIGTLVITPNGRRDASSSLGVVWTELFNPVTGARSIFPW